MPQTHLLTVHFATVKNVVDPNACAMTMASSCASNWQHGKILVSRDTPFSKDSQNDPSYPPFWFSQVKRLCSSPVHTVDLHQRPMFLEISIVTWKDFSD